MLLSSFVISLDTLFFPSSAESTESDDGTLGTFMVAEAFKL